MPRAWSIPGVTRKSSVLEAAGRTIVMRLGAVSEALDRARDRSDSENLHDLRVALRRLRATMAAYRKTFPAEAWTRLREEASEAFNPTSELRDIDVQMGRLQALRDEAPSQAYPGIDWLLDELANRETGATVSVRRALDAFQTAKVIPRVASLVETVTGVAGEDTDSGTAVDEATPDEGQEADSEPDTGDEPTLSAQASQARALAGKILSKRLRAFDRAMGSAIDVLKDPRSADTLNTATTEVLHRLRIGAKKLRYTAEIFSPVLGRPLARVSRELGDLQDVLGEIHDADVVEENVSDHLDGLPATDARVAGYAYVIADARVRRRIAQDRLENDWTPERIGELQRRLASAAG